VGLCRADVRALIVVPRTPIGYYYSYLGNSGWRGLHLEMTAPTLEQSARSESVPPATSSTTWSTIVKRQPLGPPVGVFGMAAVIARSATAAGPGSPRRDAGLEIFSVRAPSAARIRTTGFRARRRLERLPIAANRRRRFVDEIANQITRIEAPSTRGSRDQPHLPSATWRARDGARTRRQELEADQHGMVLDTDMFSITMSRTIPDRHLGPTCGWVTTPPIASDNWLAPNRNCFAIAASLDIEIDPCDRESLENG